MKYILWKLALFSVPHFFNLVVSNQLFFIYYDGCDAIALWHIFLCCIVETESAPPCTGLQNNFFQNLIYSKQLEFFCLMLRYFYKLPYLLELFVHRTLESCRAELLRPTEKNWSWRHPQTIRRTIISLHSSKQWIIQETIAIETVL